MIVLKPTLKYLIPEMILIGFSSLLIAGAFFLGLSSPIFKIVVPLVILGLGLWWLLDTPSITLDQNKIIVNGSPSPLYGSLEDVDELSLSPRSNPIGFNIPHINLRLYKKGLAVFDHNIDLFLDPYNLKVLGEFLSQSPILKELPEVRGLSSGELAFSNEEKMAKLTANALR